MDIRKRFIALSLLLSMSLNASSCAPSKKNNGKFDMDSYTSGMSKSAKSMFPFDSMNSFKLMAKYFSQLNSIKGVYPYQDYYLSSADVQKIISDNEDYGCPNVLKEDLYIALSNIAFQIGNRSGCIDDIQLDKNISLVRVLYKCLYKIFENSTNNISEDLCSLSDVRIIFTIGYDAQAEFVPEEKTIYVYWDALFNNASAYNRSVEEQLFLVLTHELLHVRQTKCKHRISDSKPKGLEYLEGYVPFYVESSAESALYNLNFDEKCLERANFDYLYFSLRYEEAYLLLLALTNNSIDGYYNAIFDADLQQLFQYFHLYSNESIEDFYRILFAMDTKNLRNDLVIDICGRDPITVGEIEKMAGLGYRIDLFRMTLKNLIVYTYVHKDFSLEEHLLLFNFVKIFIVDGAYDVVPDGDDYKTVYDPTFVNTFLEIEAIYDKFLCEYYNISIEEIDEIEDKLDMEGKFDDFSHSNKHVLASDSEIFQKFPVLKAICFVNPVYYFEWTDFKDEYSLNRSIN